jgi:stalled ribosome rescue protein Dom34
MGGCNTVVWLNEQEARFSHFSGHDTLAEATDLRPFRIRRHGPGRSDTASFHRAVAAALSGARAILVVGPGEAKLSFLRHLAAQQPTLERRVVGIETVTARDGCLTQFARRYFSHRPGHDLAERAEH